MLLPGGTNTEHMKEWLYETQSIEVVVHKWLGHPILRVSVHAHTSETDIRLLEKGVRAYFEKFDPLEQKL